MATWGAASKLGGGIPESFKRYLFGAVGYEVIRKSYFLWDAEVQTSYTRDAHKRQLLVGEKLQVFLASVAYSPALFPFHVLSDVGRIETYVRGLNPEEYGYNNTLYGPYGYVFI